MGTYSCCPFLTAVAIAFRFDEKAPSASEKNVTNLVLVVVTLERHVPAVMSLAMSEDGKTLFSARRDKVVD